MRAQRKRENSVKIMLMVALYRILLVLLMTAGLWVCVGQGLSVADWSVVLLSYIFLMLLLQKIYGACSAGYGGISELILSQTLSNLIDMGVIYVCLSLYAHRFLNLLPMMSVFAAQENLGVVWSIAVNRIYCKNYVPPRTAIVYRSDAVLDMICQSPYFDKKYDIIKLIKDPADDIDILKNELRDCDAVFAADISAELVDGIAMYCADKKVKGFIVPSLGHIVLSGAKYKTRFSVPMLLVERGGKRSFYRAFKRAFDVAASLGGIVLTMPIMLITAMLIYLEDRGPVIYRQTRLTRNGREFEILKFRSMRVNAEQDGVARLASQNDSRITKIGQFIRTCRIDELPQLFNILKGDMSIVGPRPERPEIAEQYEAELPEFALRLQVKAGLTGMAQIYGRYNTDPYHKLQMDLMYINEMSLMTDLMLIMKTMKILFVKESTAGIKTGQITAIADNNAKAHETA